MVTALPAEHAVAQDLEGVMPQSLPRRGYEQKGLRTGNTVILPELNVRALYDSNIFATAQNEEDDIIVSIAPNVRIDTDGSRLHMLTNVYLDRQQHLDNRSQSYTRFGATTSLGYSGNRTTSLKLLAGFERGAENRNDPEARNIINDPPRKLDTMSAEIRYDYKGSRFGIGVRGGVQRVNLLPPEDFDRDLTTYRGSVRASVQASDHYALFAEGYVNRRKYRVNIGDDRDVTTTGALGGVQVDIATRLSGEIGVGVFRAKPDQGGKDFSGFAANGNLVWTPRPRTALTAAVFRGDVATVRVGASGRIDTRLSLTIDQEIRHNLLFNGSIAVRQTSYRGTTERDLRLWTFQAETTYLLNRNLAIFVDGRSAKRNADRVSGDFTRSSVGLGVRLRY